MVGLDALGSGLGAVGAGAGEAGFGAGACAGTGAGAGAGVGVGVGVVLEICSSRANTSLSTRSSSLVKFAFRASAANAHANDPNTDGRDIFLSLSRESIDKSGTSGTVRRGGPYNEMSKKHLLQQPLL